MLNNVDTAQQGSTGCVRMRTYVRIMRTVRSVRIVRTHSTHCVRTVRTHVHTLAYAPCA